MTLNNHFPGWWIGRQGPKKLPRRSPYRIEYDFPWSWRKGKVCQTNPKTFDETEERISDNSATTPLNLFCLFQVAEVTAKRWGLC
jgi:hypothetical protein